MSALIPPVPSLNERRARVWLHLGEKLSWTSKHISAVPDHVLLAMYDVLWPAPKPAEKPTTTTTTTTIPNATVTLTTTTANPRTHLSSAVAGMYWPMGSTTGLY